MKLWILAEIRFIRHSHMDAENYAPNEFDKHLALADWNRVVLEGKTILEIRSGNSIATAIIAYAYGANAILLDVVPFAKNAHEHILCFMKFLGLTWLVHSGFVTAADN